MYRLVQLSGHDETHGVVADTVTAAAIVVGDASQAHLDDGKNGHAVFIENDTPFSQQRLQERQYHTQEPNAPFIRNDRTAVTETRTSPEAKSSHRSDEICM